MIFVSGNPEYNQPVEFRLSLRADGYELFINDVSVRLITRVILNDQPPIINRIRWEAKAFGGEVTLVRLVGGENLGKF